MPREPRDSQCKCWCFTLNNYSEDEFSAFRDVCERECSYAVIGKEVGENGTPHLQGYFRCKSKYRLSQIKDKFSRRAHFAVARGDAKSNREYCSKSGDVWSIGECSGGRPSKSRDELAVEYRRAFEGGSLPDFEAANPGAALFSGHTLRRNILAAAEPIERPSIRVRWVWGPPGTGKSRFAHSEFPLGFVKEPRTKWWTGYKLEKEVIIDDFGKNGIDINHLLRWFDRYRCLVETKGDMVALYADNFIVTSNFPPSEIYHDDNGNDHPQLPALLRRMEVIYMGPSDRRG